MKMPNTRNRRPGSRSTGSDSALLGVLAIMVTFALVDGLLRLTPPLVA